MRDFTKEEYEAGEMALDDALRREAKKLTPEDWLDEFYSTPAKENAGSTQHSYKKWLGMRKEVLEKYGIKVMFSGDLFTDDDEESEVLAIGSNSCSLCLEYIAYCGGPCVGCPICESRGGIRCDQEDDDGVSPWAEWVASGDPEPMIAALEKALEWEKEQAKGEER